MRASCLAATEAIAPLEWRAPSADVTFASIIIQLLNGLAAAASLFLVSAGLSLIFGVTRIVNFAHGSLYMLGLYGAYTPDRGAGPHAHRLLERGRAWRRSRSGWSAC